MKTITDALKTFYTKLGGDVSKLPSRTTSADLIEAMSDVYTDKEGTHVEVTTQVTEGTKIATIKTNNEDHDIYAPAGLPAVTSSDEGKILTVDSEGAWGAANAPTELPSVTSSDEGKVLTVDGNGDWGAATPSGGNSSFIVNIEEDSEGTVTANHTYNEIIAAYNAGKTIGCSFTSEKGYNERMYLNIVYLPLKMIYGTTQDNDIRFLAQSIGDGVLHNMEIIIEKTGTIRINEVEL